MSPELQSRNRTSERTETADPFPYGSDTGGRILERPTTAGALCGLDRLDPDGEAGSTACPLCGVETVNGAGLFTCPDCDWVATLE